MNSKSKGINWKQFLGAMGVLLLILGVLEVRSAVLLSDTAKLMSERSVVSWGLESAFTDPEVEQPALVADVKTLDATIEWSLVEVRIILALSLLLWIPLIIVCGKRALRLGRSAGSGYALGIAAFGLGLILTPLALFPLGWLAFQRDQASSRPALYRDP